VHNGEIYNFASLRAVLGDRGHHFRGTSDTEVMLAAFAEWGVAGALERFNGMFAFALWDGERRVLELARDRMGQKPLYYARAADGSFLFASELKALHEHPSFQPRIDRDALTLLLRRGCIPAPFSVYQGVRKLPAGCRLSIPVDEPTADDATPYPYWSLVAAWERGEIEPFTGGLEQAADELEPLLADAVALCRVADVPVGALLSGGVDSSLIVALLRAGGGGAVDSFSVGFRAPGYDEAPGAARIAALLGTRHHQLYVEEADALEVIPRLPELYDEPFGDSSQIPTYLISRLTRRHVTVALSGDGGDELFAGYAKYPILDRLRHLERLPSPLVRLGGSILRRVPRRGRLGDVARLGELVGRAQTSERMTIELSSIWKRPSEVVLGGDEPRSVFNHPDLWPRLSHPVRRAMAVDSLGYLPDDILVKVDRAAMAVSLETRIPLLDHRVVEWAARLPLATNLRGGVGKRVLRRVLARHLPEEAFSGPKRGFRVPLDAWLRGELRPWASNLLSEDRLRAEEYFAPDPIVDAWRRHLGGEAELSAYLWPVLMFQSWRERWPTGVAR
jgi:asparagine synthase (glutamine-hydrolysing)